MNLHDLYNAVLINFITQANINWGSKILAYSLVQSNGILHCQPMKNP